MTTPRKPNTGEYLEFTLDQAHKGDIILGSDDRTRYLIWDYQRRGVKVRLEVLAINPNDEQSGFSRWELPITHEVRLQIEHGCKCNGSGVHYGHGHFENGVFRGFTGVCFGCNGKGWQSRADVIRNSVYWDKYARVGA